jgi:hypothetical protein
MSQENIEKIEKLEKAINSPATPENIKDTMRKALEVLKAEKVEDIVEVKPYKTYSTIKLCLLDDGDDSDDYIYEGKLIHNVEVLPKDTWEIVEFYNYGVVLKHIPTSVLADSKPNKNVSLEELKSLFASDKIEIDGIEKGNTKVFNLCIKAIIKCIDSLDMAAYKENLLAELNASKNELEKTIEASNLLASEKSNLEKESADKIQTLESDISAKSISMEEATRLKDEETAKLKKKLEDLEALNSMRTLIDMLQDDIAKKDFKETPSVESNGKIKVKSITIHNAEGKTSGYGLPKTVHTYKEANDALIPVFNDAVESSYANKSRFTVTFEDGETYDGDLFIGLKYDNTLNGNIIGKHIKDYLEREINENRQSEETTKEIKEFLEKYDLGFDENPTIGDYSDINSFVDYVNDFYGKEGVYADQFKSKGFTKEEIKEAVNKYISDIDKRDDDNFTWGGGDTVDRERIRTYLEKMDSEIYSHGGKVKGTWGHDFPEVGRTGMFKGAEVIVTANRAGDILFNELDENEKVVKSDKASLSEFRSYFRPFEPRETDVIYKNGGEVVDNQFTYMMLGRLQSDNDYFLGHGNRSERSLWAGNVDAQIEEMKRLWNSLPENAKPEWLSMEDILDYEQKMKN